MLDGHGWGQCTSRLGYIIVNETALKRWYAAEAAVGRHKLAAEANDYWRCERFYSNPTKTIDHVLHSNSGEVIHDRTANGEMKNQRGIEKISKGSIQFSLSTAS